METRKLLKAVQKELAFVTAPTTKVVGAVTDLCVAIVVFCVRVCGYLWRYGGQN